MIPCRTPLAVHILSGTCFVPLPQQERLDIVEQRQHVPERRHGVLAPQVSQEFSFGKDTAIGGERMHREKLAHHTGRKLQQKCRVQESQVVVADTVFLIQGERPAWVNSHGYATTTFLLTTSPA
jgi:hypothetical protein